MHSTGIHRERKEQTKGIYNRIVREATKRNGILQTQMMMVTQIETDHDNKG